MASWKTTYKWSFFNEKIVEQDGGSIAMVGYRSSPEGLQGQISDWPSPELVAVSLPAQRAVEPGAPRWQLRCEPAADADIWVRPGGSWGL